MLFIRAGGEPVSYRAIPERVAFYPGDFILPQAQSPQVYNEALAGWRDQNFSLWNRTVSLHNNEDLVIALAAEALVRGTYRAAIAAVPPAFLEGRERTYESSAYLGNLDQAYRSLMNREREKLARLSRMLNDRSLEFLKLPGIFGYLGTRGHQSLFDAATDLVRAIDPATLALDLTPGIFEGYVDWNAFRPAGNNPFARLVDQACFVVSESLRRTEAVTNGAQVPRVFSLIGNQADTEFNLRLGRALLAYAESAQDSYWAGIGRSLILYALSLEDSSNPSPQATARLYRILAHGDFHPRAVAINAAGSNIWTWTAAQAVSAVHDEEMLEIAASFPAGETHFMIIRGVRPFTRLQLYNIDFRSDPQFERWESSGWRYIPQEQTLIVKMRHRTPVEHIRIFY